MNKITTLAEYKIHKNKLNRESYHKRKSLLKNARNASGELIYKPKIKKEKILQILSLKELERKNQMIVLLIIHFIHLNIYFVNIFYLSNAVLNFGWLLVNYKLYI